MAELKDELIKHGLAATGKKDELVERLLDAASPSFDDDDDAPSGPAVEASSGTAKYVWTDVEDHVFTPRTPYEGSEEPVLSDLFDDLTTDSKPCS